MYLSRVAVSRTLTRWRSPGERAIYAHQKPSPVGESSRSTPAHTTRHVVNHASPTTCHSWGGTTPWLAVILAPRNSSFARGLFSPRLSQWTSGTIHMHTCTIAQRRSVLFTELPRARARMRALLRSRDRDRRVCPGVGSRSISVPRYNFSLSRGTGRTIHVRACARAPRKNAT